MKYKYQKCHRCGRYNNTSFKTCYKCRRARW